MFSFIGVGKAYRPELKWFQSGNCCLTFGMQLSRKNKHGSWEKEYINVKCFNKTAEWVDAWLHEKQIVSVEGEPWIETYTDREGHERKRFVVFANRIKNQTPRESSAQAHQGVYGGPPISDTFSEELPPPVFP